LRDHTRGFQKVKKDDFVKSPFTPSLAGGDDTPPEPFPVDGEGIIDFYEFIEKRGSSG